MDIRKRTQICFDITKELKEQVKIAAIKRNISMNLWITRAILGQLSREP